MMSPAKTALVSFLVPIIGFLAGFQFVAHSFTGLFIWQLLWNVALSFVLLQTSTAFAESDFKKSVTIHSVALGFLFSIGCQLVVFTWRQQKTESEVPFLLPLGLFLFTLATYHFSEFATIALVSPHTVTTSDFVLRYDFVKDRPDGPIARALNWISAKTYPELEHHLSLLASLTEFTFETAFWPEVKFSHLYFCYLGFGLCMGAEVIRKTAMISAGRSFNHVVQEEPKAGHRLVTQGPVYGRWRHPSYLGQFLWYLGLQILLLNPLSAVAIPATVWLYLKVRIAREEVTLVEFFGAQYIQYRARVSSGLPGVK